MSRDWLSRLGAKCCLKETAIAKLARAVMEYSRGWWFDISWCNSARKIVSRRHIRYSCLVRIIFLKFQESISQALWLVKANLYSDALTLPSPRRTYNSG